VGGGGGGGGGRRRKEAEEEEEEEEFGVVGSEDVGGGVGGVGRVWRSEECRRMEYRRLSTCRRAPFGLGSSVRYGSASEHH
jgi:hypothetical protein